MAYMDVVRKWIAFFALFFICACSSSGSGGGNTDDVDGDGNGNPVVVQKTVITGTAMKGPIRYGKVELFSLESFGAGRLVDSVTTDALNGSYTFDDVNISGPVQVLVSEGNYKDEATGDNVILDAADTMLAMIATPATGKTHIVNITPLTTMAAAMVSAAGDFTDEQITNANIIVSRFYKIDDIITTTPVDVVQNNAIAGKSRDAIDYGLLLAGFSILGAQLDLENPFKIVSVLSDDASDGIFDGKNGPVTLKINEQPIGAALGYAGLLGAAKEFEADLSINLSGAVVSSTLFDVLGASTGYIRNVSPPKITNISPSSGPISGNVPITVTGSFLQGATLTIGDNEAAILSVELTNTQDVLTATLPENENEGSVNVVITNPDGQTATLTSGFLYVSPPVITDVSPLTGKQSGSSSITITGTGFLNGATVTIGEEDAVGVIVNENEITFKTPPGEKGAAEIVVTNSDGQQDTFVGFTYLDETEEPLSLSITTVMPKSANMSADTLITVVGRGFTRETQINAGGVDAVDVVLVSSNILTATLPLPENYGPIPLDVSVVENGVTRTLSAAFRYVKEGAAPSFEFTGYRVAADSDDSVGVVFADIDNDGDADLIVANRSAQNRLYINNGNTYSDETETYLPLAEDDTSDVKAAYINDDEYIDLFFANRGTDVMLINQNGISFTDETKARMPLESETHLLADEPQITFVDIDGDDDSDIFVLYEGLQPRLYTNNNGSFFDKTPSVLPAKNAKGAVFGNFTGGPELDIVVAVMQGEPYILRDLGKVEDIIYPFFTSLSATDVVSDDLDADGDPDIVFATTSGLRLYLGDASGLFTEAAQNLPEIFDIVRSVNLTDINNDGTSDMLLANSGENRIFLNDGNGVFTENSFNGFESPTYACDYWPKTGSVNTVFCANSNGNQNRIYELSYQDDTIIVANVTGNLPQDSLLTRDVESADIDGDGDLDVLIVNDNSTMSRLLINDGSGVFTDETVARFGTSRPVGNAEEGRFADINYDGFLDLIIINDNFEQDRLFINNGLGFFTDETGTRLPNDSENGEGVAVGDIDGDGFVDLVTAEFGSERILINNGTGYFTDETVGRFPFTDKNVNDTSAEVMLFDMDKDGDLDIFVINNDEVGINTTNRANRLYMNNASGYFTEVTSQFPFENDHSRDADIGDIDSDGDLDILVANDIYNTETPENRIYWNNGFGTFAWLGHPGLDIHTGDTSEDITLVDLEGDGDLDVFVSNDITVLDRLYINDSTGRFTNLQEGLPSLLNETNDADIADFDGDGDLDIIIGNTGQSRLLVNKSL